MIIYLKLKLKRHFTSLNHENRIKTENSSMNNDFVHFFLPKRETFFKKKKQKKL